jgi:2-polyprenyl-6-methoxyphenol hydroxylase-like FAD-dependent oxidoreductase
MLRDVDVLVVGASSDAVAAALALRRQGRRVMVVSDLSYFGEDTAGTLTCAPVLPGAAKRALELTLVQADIPFLYLARPVALLRDGDGRIAGAALAARTALLAVTCRAVVDATRHGVVHRLAGARRTPRRGRPATMGWTVIAKAPPAGAEALPTPFRCGEEAFQAYRLQVPRSADPFSREHAARAAVCDPNVLVTADILADEPDDDFAPIPDVFTPRDLRGASDAAARPAPPVPSLRLCTPVPDPSAGGPRSPSAGGCRSDSRIDRRRPEVEGHLFRFAPAFWRQPVDMLGVSPSDFPVLGRFDVVVAGGGTGGAPAGIAAAREGARTVVLEIQHELGGVGTIGLVGSYWYGNRVGFTAELDRVVLGLDPDGHADGGRIWRPEIKAAAYHRLLRAAGGTAWLGSFAFGVRMAGDRVDGVLVSTPFGCGLIEAGCVVDATGNADVAAAAGAPCRVIGAEHVATQGTGLPFRQDPGVRACNTDHTFVDETDPEGVTAAFVNARAKFAGAFDIAPLVDTRERRQAVGDCAVSPLDILAQRTFPDTVVTASSNFDTHGFIVHPVFMVEMPDNQAALWARVPFRSLLPLGVEGVLVTGLGMSAERDALPLLRMQPDVQNQGFVAGLAAATAAASGRRVRDLDIRALQRRLAGLGIVPPEVAQHEDSFPLPSAAVAAAARGDLRVPLHAAILFAHPETGRPLLRQRLEGAADAAGREDAALILGLMGCAEAAPALAEAVRRRGWDDGWSFRGMHQAGASMSRMDSLTIALARTQAPAAVDAIEEKIRALPDNPAFSHCRAVAVAAAVLRDTRLGRALADLLRRPGLSGHAQCDLASMLARVNADGIETQARNDSLRELYLARGLFLAGDVAGLGRRILEEYALDLRGPFARHARAVLDRPAGAEQPCREA